MDAPEEKSKKPSATNPDAPHENLVFFVDRCLGRALWRDLRALGVNAEHKDDHFAADTEDEAWMPRVGENGWIVLTRDTRIRMHPNEQSMIFKANLKVFSLQTRRGINGAAIFAIFRKHLARMQETAVAHAAPFVAGVTRNGVRIMNIPPSTHMRKE
jgi:predicted nuclease of predicted toxin-antitoxin system